MRGVYLSAIEAAVRSALNPGLALLPTSMDSPEARVEMLAIGLQESRLQFRYQKTRDPYVKGPARGLWQFERGGGVRGVMSHPASDDWAREVCRARDVPFDESLIHTRLEYDDVLACGFARLLLFTDPRPLPALDAPAEEAWDYYIRNWRPGKPHRETWDALLGYAREAVLQ